MPTKRFHLLKHILLDTMKLFVANVHCKHIILCASSDNSYTGFLRRFVDNGKVSDHITLVEAISFPQDLAKLSPSFLGTNFSSIFRDTKISTKPLFKAGESGQSSSVPNVSYASTASKQPEGASRANKPVISSPAPLKAMHSRLGSDALQQVYVNAANQRVDFKVPHYNRDIVFALMARKLCHRHFLSCCTYVSCVHDHKGDLDSSELAALRFIARRSACENGVGCRDPYCLAAHMCIYGTKCVQPENCRYPQSMHYLDSGPAQPVPAWS